MSNMKMLNKSRVFKYVSDTFYSKGEFEDSTNDQFNRLFGRFMNDGEFNNLCWWCRKNVDLTDTTHGYRLLLGRMGRSRIGGEILPRYMFLRRAARGGYKRFTNRELVVGQMVAANHSNVVTSHTQSISHTLYALELGTTHLREKRVFRTLRRAVEQGRISAQEAAEEINQMVME